MSSPPIPTRTCQGAVDFWAYQQTSQAVSAALAGQGATACRTAFAHAIGAGWQATDLRALDVEAMLNTFAGTAAGKLKPSTIAQYQQHTRRAVTAVLALHGVTPPARSGTPDRRTHTLPLPSGAVTTLRLPPKADRRDVEFIRRVANLYADSLTTPPAEVEVVCFQDPDSADVVSAVAVFCDGHRVLAPRLTIVDPQRAAAWRSDDERATALATAQHGTSTAAAELIGHWLLEPELAFPHLYDKEQPA
ncbi:hypothetical protein [Longispora albida]|uniref:hypothetical protein n=1 Tax=Longispora albida TaxID=203523 RepID=UPI000369371F|nr:hypothetical protein [Longispora albida]